MKKLTKTTYICKLSEQTQNEIKKHILQFLGKEGYTKEEQKEIIKNAMNGRLCDIEENIDITKYIK